MKNGMVILSYIFNRTVIHISIYKFILSLNAYTVYPESSTLLSLSNQIFKQVCKTQGKYFLYSKQKVVYIFFQSILLHFLHVRQCREHDQHMLICYSILAPTSWIPLPYRFECGLSVAGKLID